VIIENNEAKAQKFASENWLMLIGDAHQEQTLRDAQIDARAPVWSLHHHRRYRISISC